MTDVTTAGSRFEAVHWNPRGCHTVVVCVPDRYAYGPRLLNAVEWHLAVNAMPGPVTDAVCSAHLIRHADADGPAAPAATVHIDDVDHDALTGRWAQVADLVHAEFVDAVAGTEPVPPVLLEGGPSFELMTHPRVRRLLNREPGLADTATELFGVGLQALQAGAQTYRRYLTSTVAYGHGLVTCEARLLRSGFGGPSRDRLDQRLAYAEQAREYLARLRDAVVCVVHVDLPDPAALA